MPFILVEKIKKIVKEQFRLILKVIDSRTGSMVRPTYRPFYVRTHLKRKKLRTLFRLETKGEDPFASVSLHVQNENYQNPSTVIYVIWLARTS